MSERLLSWEQEQSDTLLADVFGYHALQLGWPALQALRSNRMPNRWLAHAEFEEPSAGIVWPLQEQTAEMHLHFDSRAWPWPADSLDLVVLPHTLERSADPHACLREVARVLIPEGHVMITGFNPLSFWACQLAYGQRKRSAQGPCPLRLVAYRRLRDWLRLLGFEVQISRFWGWTPALASEAWVRRLHGLEAVGQRWCPIIGGVYLILATKRVTAGRWINGRPRRAVRSPVTATVPVARSDNTMGLDSASKDIG